MLPRFNLQWRLLLLVAGGMTLVLVLSAHLHGLITRSLIQEAGYNHALGQTVAIAGPIVPLDLFRDPEELRRDIFLPTNVRRDFEQIDIYQNTPAGLRLIATNMPTSARLPALDQHATDNDLGE